MSRHLRAGSSIFVRARFVRSSCSCPPGSGQLTHLLYSGIPYSSVIYLCAKYFFPYILLLLLGYLYIDDLGDGVDAKSSMGRPGRRGAYLSPLGLAWPTFIITLLDFSRVYNRVISEWSIGLFVSISGSRPSNSNGSSSESVLTACQWCFTYFSVHPITSNVLTFMLSTARRDIDDSRAVAPVHPSSLDIRHHGNVRTA
jgi:hypothetical protein